MPNRTGSKGCLYRHTSSPELTLTRRRCVGRQGAPSSRTSCRLVVIPCRRESSCYRQTISRQAGRMRTWSMLGLGMRTSNDKQRSNLTLKDGEEGGDRGESARGGCPLAKAFGDRGHHPLQTVDVRLRCGGYMYLSVVWQTMSAAGDAKWTGRWIARCSSRRTRQRRD